jgi:hemoglobin
MEEKNTARIPTLYEWAGGMPVFEKLTDVFYKKVLQDPLLEPVFKHMSPEHQLHVAHFIAEVFGGPEIYSTEEGDHFRMIQKHLAKHLTEQHRKRWVELLLESSDEINLPDDNETAIAINPDEPMPKWGWGVPGKPFQN